MSTEQEFKKIASKGFAQELLNRGYTKDQVRSLTEIYPAKCEKRANIREEAKKNILKVASEMKKS